MKLSDFLKDRLLMAVVCIINGLLVLFLLSFLTFVQNFLSFLWNNIGHIISIFIFLVFVDWLSNQTKKKEINKKEECPISYNANCWTEEELNMIYRDRFLREQKERYDKDKIQ